MSERVTEYGRVMLEHETQLGRMAIWPDNAPFWLIREDWDPWPVLSVLGGELFIVAVNATRKGSLTRLITRAALAGLRPVIVCPIGQQMPAILDHWGWKRSRREDIGGGWFDEWRPE